MTQSNTFSLVNLLIFCCTKLQLQCTAVDMYKEISIVRLSLISASIEYKHATCCNKKHLLQTFHNIILHCSF